MFGARKRMGKKESVGWKVVAGEIKEQVPSERKKRERTGEKEQVG